MVNYMGLILIFAVAASSCVTASVKPNGLFSDNAVLQQGIRVPVWGTAEDGERVTIEFQDQKVSTTAKGGFWIGHLEPLEPGGPFKMKINDLVLENILVGEVWVCSGQSNMAWQLHLTENAEEAIASADDSMLRLFLVPKVRTSARPKELPQNWKESNPDSARDFSAVGYYFGRHLREVLGVPVGLIDSSVGGTTAEAWTSRAVLKRYTEFDELRRPPFRSSYLYNNMISHIVPYGIKGAIWYQGESNASRAEQYRTLFPTMIAGWREAWGQGDFPFLFVQLAPFATTLPEGAWAELRDAQLHAARTVANTAMAVTTDVGDEKDIHPQRKKPVGDRLALAARAIAYGEKIVYSGPMYKSMHIEGNRAGLSFDHVGGGLVADGGPLKGFEILGPDGEFVEAKAEIVGDQVIVYSPEVRNPKSVRFGWANCPVLNFFNKEGLPASPFKTD